MNEIEETLPVYLINLDRETKRLAFMQSQLSKLGLSFMRVSACDGSQEIAFLGSGPSRFSSLTRSEIGCFESHKRVWKQILDSGVRAAIVLEDDVILASDFAVVAQRAVENLDFDLVRLEFYLPSILASLSGPEIGRGRRLHRYLGEDLATGAYIISSSGARKLLKISEHYYRPVDCVMYNRHDQFLGRSRIFSVVPAPSVQSAMQGEMVAKGADFGSSVQRSSNSSEAGGFKKHLFRLWRWSRFDSGFLKNLRYQRLLRTVAKDQPIGEVSNSYFDPAQSVSSDSDLGEGSADVFS